MHEVADLPIFELRPFSEAWLESTRLAWRAHIDNHEMFDLEYQRVLDAATNQINYAHPPNGHPMAYGVFRSGAADASAIVLIVYTPRPGPSRGWLKMLEVNLSPQYDEFVIYGDMEKYHDALQIFAAAINGTLDLRGTHRSKVVKLYGRNESMLKLLTGVGEQIVAKGAAGVTVAMHGRWLVISEPGVQP
ncbi:hypothetical protein [Ralstonia solanacearum]|uniref:hypothetical protein n=2 Tax=Ralstonia solanacearum TaxID=305 RepID=UPI0012D46235|nr:hypothetical protein [Ralstonia solanacearum]MDC6179050.1 hypothetical protein [Ralstonia solanacearum]MDC6211537.1 hypothetical protein [Ralstonia solanacearum]MDC6240280.1 hypothetical protein [Ralstonia solanacearum]MDD7802025.1 hypothetical protein [Ralstonia solanacearum]